MPHSSRTWSADDVLDGLRTPDDRYIVVGGRLWRASNPALDDAERVRWVTTLMDARRTIGSAKRRGDAMAERRARQRVQPRRWRSASAALCGGTTGRRTRAGDSSTTRATPRGSRARSVGDR